MKITKTQLKNLVHEVMTEESEYQQFFKKALEKTGKSIPEMSDEEKKDFFNKIDAAWKSKGEKNERFGRGVEGPTFGSANESVNEKPVNEGIGTIALGIMLAWAGLKVITYVATRVIGKVAANTKISPETLKLLVNEMVKKVASQTGKNKVLLLATSLKIDLDKKIDSGEIKTIKDVKKAMEVYLRKNVVKESVNEALSVDPRKVYGGTGAKEGMVLTSQKGLMKILDLSKKNPSNVFLVSDDNYTKFGPYYVKNGKVAKYTVANPNYDLEKNKVRTLKVPSDVILKFKIVEGVSVNEAFKHIIHVDTPTQVVSKPIAAQIMALAKKGVRSKEIGLEMGFTGNAKLAADTFQKVKNRIYFDLDKRESVNEIGMFNNPVGYKKSKPEKPTYTKKYVSKGVYDIFKNGKKVKTVKDGEGAANAWMNNARKGQK